MTDEPDEPKTPKPEPASPENSDKDKVTSPDISVKDRPEPLKRPANIVEGGRQDKRGTTLRERKK